jgi:galactose mutarotase-like enzyme
MVGCGLDNVGMPSSDAGEELGLHGRLSHTPAELLGCGGEWQGDEYTMWVKGRVRHYVVFGANLSLERRISTRLGANHLRIQDTITNLGYDRTPYQVLYHCNFGFPVVSPDTELLLKSEKSEPRDEEAAEGFAEHARFQVPTPGYSEKVYYHHPIAEAGYCRAALVNRALSWGAYVRFRKAELPYLIEWKMMGQGTYVVGLEPANCGVQGRAHDRAQGVLRTLEPGESVSPALEIGVLPDAEAIQTYVGT